MLCLRGDGHEQRRRAVIDRSAHIRAQPDQLPHLRLVALLSSQPYYSFFLGHRFFCRNTDILSHTDILLTGMVELVRIQRSCIGALQFASAKNKRFNQETLRSTLGKKDRREGVMTVYERVFRTKTSTRGMSGSRAQARKLSKSGGELERTNTLVDLIQSNGMYNKLVEGCFEHYPTAKGIGTFDPKLQKMENINDWTVFDDIMCRQIQQHQHFTLMKYRLVTLSTTPRFELYYMSLSRGQLVGFTISAEPG